MGNMQRMPRFTLQKEISSENQRNCIRQLCEISNALWKRDREHRPEWDRDFAKNRRSQ